MVDAQPGEVTISRNHSRFSDAPFYRIRDGMLWGARVYPPYGDGVVLVKQTIRQGSESVLDSDDAGRHRERNVDYQDDGEPVKAIRGALQGQLSNDG